MIVVEAGITFEVVVGGSPMAPLYYAHTHCWCGSTLGSGEFWPTIAKAVAEARDGIDGHNRADNHAAVPCPDCNGRASGGFNCKTCSGRGRVARGLK